MKKEMNQSQYAKHRGVSRSYINQLLKTGKIPAAALVKKGRHRLINVAIADRSLLKNLEPSRKKKIIKDMGVGGMSYSEARTLHEQLKVALKQMELKIMRGDYVLVDDVNRQGFTIGMQIKEALKAMPERLAPTLAAESDAFEIKQILNIEINMVLEGLFDALKVQ